jgi:hypothetical protein
MFVPPGRVRPAGGTPTGPRPIPPTLPGTAPRPARLNGVRPTTPARPVPVAGSAPSAPETVPAPGDRELWTVKKPKHLLQGAPPAPPVAHGKPIGSPG